MRLNPANPLNIWGGGGSISPVSPAQAIWGADCELYWSDCPQAPGPWVDRIGGLVATCYGTAWFEDSDGAVGVSTSAVSYVDITSLAAMFFGNSCAGERTVAMILANCTTTSTQSPLLVQATSGVSEGCCTSKGAAFNAVYWATQGRNFTTYYRPRVFSDALGLYAFTIQPAVSTSMRRLFANSDTMAWTNAFAAAVTTPTPATATLFRKNGASTGIADTTVRQLAVRAIASGAGLADPVALRTWAEAEGVVWP